MWRVSTAIGVIFLSMGGLARREGGKRLGQPGYVGFNSIGIAPIYVCLAEAIRFLLEYYHRSWRT